MKRLLRTLCRPILKPLESGDEPFDYKPLNRKILLVTGALFLVLAAVVWWLMPAGVERGYLIPIVVFGAVGLTGLIVGSLGNDRAVAKIWGSRS